MFGGLGDIANLVKAAKDLQGNMARLQEELASRRHQGDAGGGMVRVIVDGRLTLIDIKIEPDAASDVELLEDLVKAAFTAAMSKAQESMKTDMASLTGGVNVPGLSNLFGSKAG
jgi:DNA-binding YbaB/EbfC family protein